jgi:hypothetical protein
MKYIIFTLFFVQSNIWTNNLEINYIIKYITRIYKKNGTLLVDVKQNKSYFLSRKCLKTKITARTII